ncbi:MAG: GNAT family N-acetyltransferase [Pseudomonadota bacterium]
MQREPQPLVLRPPTREDLQAVFEIHSDPRTNRFNPSGPMASMAAAQELLDRIGAHWSQHGFGYWLVALPEAPQRVLGIGGLIEKQVPGYRGLNLYYRFRPEAWGRGLATAVGRRAIGFADVVLGRRQDVFARVRPDNEPSIRVLERLGLEHVGHTADEGDDLMPSLVYRLPSRGTF